MTDEERRDLDETRRLATMVQIGQKAGRTLSVDLVGTFVHAIAYHSQLADCDWAERLGVNLLDGVLEYAAVEYVIDRVNEKLAA